MHDQPTPIHYRPWTLSCLSTKLIESHYENNHGGALRRLNAITEQLETLDWANTPGHVIDGLKRDQYATEHNQAVAAGIPILALDMYEHADTMDYGANAKAYVDVFMRNVDWNALHARYKEAAKVGGLRPLEQPDFGSLRKLRDLDFDAKFMQGGHSAWKAIGGSVDRHA